MSWSNAGLIGWWVESLLINPKDPSVLYAGAEDVPDDDSDGITRVFKSTDGGASWNDIVPGVRLRAIDPQDTDTLYGVVGLGLFKSTDGGANWTKLSAFPANLQALSLTIDPQNHTTLYAPVAAAYNMLNEVHKTVRFPAHRGAARTSGAQALRRGPDPSLPGEPKRRDHTEAGRAAARPADRLRLRIRTRRCGFGSAATNTRRRRRPPPRRTRR